jgi:tryptophan-rich sensory protein
VEIVVLWLAIVVTIYLFWHVNTIAVYLLVPYILWYVIFNFAVVLVYMHVGAAADMIKSELLG